MRLIGQVENEDLARRFSVFLKKKGIDSRTEKESESQTGKASSLIWVLDEDKIETAFQLFEEFKKNPHDAKYDVPIDFRRQKRIIEEVSLVPKKRKQTHYVLTLFFIAICGFIYFLNLMQEASANKNNKEKPIIVITPIQLLCFYDVPSTVVRLSEVLKKYPLDSLKQDNQLPQSLKSELENIDKMPQWRGVYNWLLVKIKKENVPSTGPMFVKILQGEVWRVFSPCVLHTSFLHLLFNMLWLWVLGRQMEDRVKRWKILVMIIVIGVISNTLQYLASGPLFLGFSGIIVGMAAFIWTRQKQAPWEGYAFHKSTFLFLSIFVFGMLFLQIISFIIQSLGYNFSLNIANTAHISGGILGYFFGRSTVFASEV